MRRFAKLRALLVLCSTFGLVGVLAASSPARTQDRPAEPATAAPDTAAAAAAPATAAPDPLAAPNGPDSTGATYTGASTSAALTKDSDKTTAATHDLDIKQLKMGLNIAWTLLCGFLIMFMQAGFALVETGLTRAKNVAHTMAMNFGIYAIGMIGFWICGFAFMAGGWGPVVAFDGPNILDSMFTVNLLGKPFDLFGYEGFFLAGPANDATVLTLFLFQMVFMDTTATIPTGAMAERWKFSSFCIYGFVLSMFIYPIYGCWVWGGGWLADLGTNFGLGNGHIDFAGSSVVHMTGGVAALAGALILGPRIGKFNKDGSPNAIPGHDVAQVVLGTLILAFGWFGFNTGSTMAATDLRMPSVAVCTMLATAAGCLTSMGYMWAVFGKPDPTMGCNGLLAGAVAITAPCAFVDPIAAVIIGGLAGVLVVWSVLFVERVLKVDDPVGAVSVHGVCGAFGCICIGLFANGQYGGGLNGISTAPLGLFYGGGFSQLAAQSIGVLSNIAWVFPTAFLTFFVLEKTIGNRVPARDEIEGLDIPEMGVTGYVNEDSIAVQVAGQEHLTTFGPGVPSRKSAESKVTVGQ
ncbi:MAG: ammonium transporter [Isosphaeraceae bacterium]